MSHPAVFLDRDGVLNDAVVREGRPHPPASPAEVVVPDGGVGACHRLVDIGFQLVVVTNQPDIARGTTTAEVVSAINRRVTRDLPVLGVLVCPHDDSDGCSCRKPAPGLLIEAAQRWDLDLTGSVMVGDRWRDIGAGAGAGTTTVFIDHGYDEPRPDSPDLIARNLVDAVEQIALFDLVPSRTRERPPS